VSPELPPAPLVLSDPQRVGLLTAELVANRLSARPAARLLLPTGRAPLAMYAALRAQAARGDLRSEQATVLQLDEYAGLGPADPRSLAAMLRDQLRGVPLAALRGIDGSADDLAAEAARHESVLETAPIDLAVLGLGRDGHVAMDEPPARFASGVRVVEPAPDTRLEAAPAFGDVARVPARALTVGLGTLYRVRELIVLATGAEKAPALRAMIEEPVGTDCPASLLRDHPRLTVICDREAASLLTPRPQFTSGHVLVVLGHREPGISPEHRISAESRARLRRALDIARRRPVRAAVLTGYTSTGGLSEAEQMKATWDEHTAPALLEVAGRNTAENASRSLPLLLALGDARRVTVVSSAWHIRVPWFFAPYRRFGLDVSYRASFIGGQWPRMLREELRQARRAGADRRAAMASVRPMPEEGLEPPTRGS
jgi:glucosamine-6-phosphate deaminase